MFTIKLDLPSGKEVRIPELKNGNYLTILKYCQNEDYEGLNNFFEKLYLTPDLNIFDRFFLLLYIRKMFVSSKLEFVGKDEANVSYYIDDILSRLINNYVDDERDITYNNIHIKVGIPKCSYFNSIDEMLQGAITTVRFGDNEIDFATLSNEDKCSILRRLPSQIFVQLQEYIDDLSERLFDLTIINENEEFEISEIKVNLLSNGILYFITSIFKYDLIAFYEMLYNYNQFVSKGADNFFKLTFNEVKLLLNIHSDRIEQENEKIKRENQ